MITMLKTQKIITSARSELINITNMIIEAVIVSEVKEGICVIFVPHTTCGVTINENADPDVKRDIVFGMNKLIPNDKNFRHMEGNSDSHIKTSLFGASEHIIIKDGRPLLGTWQGIYFCEFDGPRERTVYIKIIEG